MEQDKYTEYLKKELTSVTPFSKYFALVIFITLPFVGFWMGINYEKKNHMPLDRVVVLEPDQRVPVIVEEDEEIDTPTRPDDGRERGTLFVVRTEGGLCVYGGCWNELILYTDGSWEYQEGEGTFEEGTIGFAEVRELIFATAAADFDDIRDEVFEETCPVAFDGQKKIYTFYTERGVEVIDSCESNVTKSPFIWDVVDQFVFDVHAIRANN